jgi:hypothetical protein
MRALAWLLGNHPIIGLAMLGGLTWYLWPISGWLWIAIISWIIFTLLRNRLLRPADGEPAGAVSTSVGLVASTFANASFYVGLGIAFVALVQLILLISAQAVSPEQVARGEEYLSLIFQQVSSIMTTERFLILLAGALVLNLLLPFSGLVDKFLYARSALSRLVFFLIGATSFSFFSAEAVNLKDPEWRRAEYARARFILNEIETINRETAASLWLEKEIKQAPAATKEDYANFFKSVKNLRPSLNAVTNVFDPDVSYKSEVVRDAARSVANGAPKIDAASAASSHGGNTLAVADQELLRLEASLQTSAREETLAQLRKSNEKLLAARARYEALKTAAIEGVSEVIAQFVPQSERPLIRAFVAEVSSAVANNALSSLRPNFSPEASAAKTWVEGVTAAHGKSAAASEWKLGLRPLASAQAGASSEALMALYAASLQSNAALRAAEMRRLSFAKAGGFSTPHVRVRPRVRFRF